MRLALLTLIVAAATAHAAPPAEPWPTEGWARSTPERLGIDSAAVAGLNTDVGNGKYPLVDSLLVARCGRVGFDRRYQHNYGKIFYKEAHERGPLNAHLTGPYNYFDPNWHPYYHGTQAHSMQSVSKTVTSVTIGVAMQRGDFKAGLDTPVMKYFDIIEVANVDERKLRMTLRDVLTMTTGLDWNEDLPYDDPNNACSVMEARGDWVKFVIDRPMLHDPGQVFAYSSGATMLLAHIFKKETGQDIDAYARTHLFGPLGIRDFYWKHSPKGDVDTEGGLYLKTEDLAKIGYLYLRRGQWAGRQIVPESWVEDSVKPHVTVDQNERYGYQWWLLPYGNGKLAYAGRGIGGQTLLVYPEEQLIVVTTAWHILTESWLERDITDRLLPGLKPVDCSALAH
jgi:CubicO group peptidase (beta-lactamase class C family)